MLFAAKHFGGAGCRFQGGFAGKGIEFKQAVASECGDDGLAHLVAEFGKVDRGVVGGVVGDVVGDLVIGRGGGRRVVSY